MKFSLWIVLGMCLCIEQALGQTTPLDYNNPSLNPFLVIQEAVTEAYNLCIQKVSQKYKVYIQGSRVRATSQKFVRDTLTFTLSYNNPKTFTSYEAMVEFDVVLWEPTIVYFVWSTSIADLLSFVADKPSLR